MNRLKRQQKLVIWILVIGFLTSFLLMSVYASSNNNRTFKIFDSNTKASAYYQKLKEDKVHIGKHKVVDKVKNKYYWINNNDLGNPTEGGYGDMKTYYKNGEIWKFKFKNKYVIDTAQFIVNDKSYHDIKSNTLIFCIQPLNIAEWISDNDKNNSIYEKLTANEKEKINLTIGYATRLFSETGNYDYLASGQLLVWRDLGATEISIPESIKQEYNRIIEEKNDFYKNISFLNNDILKLKYNELTGDYRNVFQDKNKILDKYFLQKLIGNYQNKMFLVTRGKEKDTLEIIHKKKDTNILDLSAIYNPLPEKGGTIIGINYQSTPIYINSNQDLIAGMGMVKKINLRVQNQLINGKMELKKVGIDERNKEENLQNVVFKIYQDINKNKIIDDNDLDIGVVKTNEMGIAQKDSLNAGNYIVKEISTNENYIISNKLFYFQIVKDNEIVKLNYGKPIYNYQKKGEIIIKKEDKISKKRLKGAIFTLYKDINFNHKYDQQDLKIATRTTNENGEIIVNNLDSGEYFIKEIKAPLDYKENSSVNKILIKPGLKKQLIIYNQQIQHHLLQTGSDFLYYFRYIILGLSLLFIGIKIFKKVKN